jgi:hypothetical protein
MPGKIGTGNGLEAVAEELGEVEAGLEAVCELLRLTNGARVNAALIHALLRPWHKSLARVTNTLADTVS